MKVFGGVVILVLGYLLLWPVPIAPISWQAPSSSGFSGEFIENNRLAGLSFIELGEDKGPDALSLFSKNGVSGTTVEQVSELANVSKSNLLYYFCRKCRCRRYDSVHLNSN